MFGSFVDSLVERLLAKRTDSIRYVRREEAKTSLQLHAASISDASGRGVLAAIHRNRRDRRDVQSAFLRVARLPPPAARAAVLAGTHGARARLAANARITARMQRIHRHVERLEVIPYFGFGPVRERIELRDVARGVVLFLVQFGTRDRLFAALARHPCADIRQRAIERLDLADLAAALAQIASFIERVQTMLRDVFFDGG